MKTHQKVKRPNRDPDFYSKRGVAYWWFPDWVRGTTSTNKTLSRIFPFKKRDQFNEIIDVDLHMVGRDGNLTYIQGSIQQEFRDWHKDNQIDYILLGMDDEEVLNVDWRYE